MRGKMGAKRMDMSDLRDALADDRLWLTLGRVVVPEGASSHYRLVRDGDQIVEVLVEVETVPHQHDLTCRLGMGFGGPLAGLIGIPPVGTEVAVAIPEGKVDYLPVVVCVLNGPDCPAPARTDAGRTVLVATQPLEIIAPQVTITDSEGGAELATKADVQAVVNAINSASFVLPVVTVGPGQVAKGPPSVPVPSPSGTTVLKAK